MVRTLEAIRGGGGSVKVGTVGTISSLMTRELESSTSASHVSSSPLGTQVLGSHVDGPLKPKRSDDQSSSSAMRTSIKQKSPEVAGRTSGQSHQKMSSNATPRRQKQKVPSEYNGISSVSNKVNRRSLDISGKTRSDKRSLHIPNFSTENNHLEKTPLREKPTRKGTNIVDIVDINCGNPAGSLSNRLKKLGLSRMSQSFM